MLNNKVSSLPNPTEYNSQPVFHLMCIYDYILWLQWHKNETTLHIPATMNGSEHTSAPHLKHFKWILIKIWKIYKHNKMNTPKPTKAHFAIIIAPQLLLSHCCCMVDMEMKGNSSVVVKELEQKSEKSNWNILAKLLWNTFWPFKVQQKTFPDSFRSINRLPHYHYCICQFILSAHSQETIEILGEQNDGDDENWIQIHNENINRP